MNHEVLVGLLGAITSLIALIAYMVRHVQIVNHEENQRRLAAIEGLLRKNQAALERLLRRGPDEYGDDS